MEITIIWHIIIILYYVILCRIALLALKEVSGKKMVAPLWRYKAQHTLPLPLELNVSTRLQPRMNAFIKGFYTETNLSARSVQTSSGKSSNWRQHCCHWYEWLQLYFRKKLPRVGGKAGRIWSCLRAVTSNLHWAPAFTIWRDANLHCTWRIGNGCW